MSRRFAGLLLCLGLVSAESKKSPLDSLLELLTPGAPEMTDGGAFCASNVPDGGTPELDFTGEVNGINRVLWLNDLEHAEGNPVIHIRINTPGGDTDEMMLIAQALEHAGQTSRVECLVDGEAASAGFFILQSCTWRSMTRRAILMVHEPYSYEAAGAANKNYLLSVLGRIDAKISQYLEHCGARLKISLAELKRRTRGVDWWIAPDEALKIGAVDALVPSPNTPRPTLPDAGRAD